jgi:hypothetical protein
MRKPNVLILPVTDATTGAVYGTGTTGGITFPLPTKVVSAALRYFKGTTSNLKLQMLLLRNASTVGMIFTGTTGARNKTSGWRKLAFTITTAKQELSTTQRLSVVVRKRSAAGALRKDNAFIVVNTLS